MSCSSPQPTRFVSSICLLCALLAAPPVRAQQADEATISLLANVLSAADARRFDGAGLREALSHPSPAVRRQGALAAGRSGDPAAIDLLLPALNDSAAVVQAAAAFALGLLKDARPVPALVQTIRATAATDGGAPQVEAVTAIAKIGGDDGAKALTDILAAGSPAAASPPHVASARHCSTAPVSIRATRLPRCAGSLRIAMRIFASTGCARWHPSATRG